MIPIYKHLFGELDPTRIFTCCYLWSVGVCLDGISKYLLLFHIKQVRSTFSARSQKTSIAVTSVISFFLLLAQPSRVGYPLLNSLNLALQTRTLTRRQLGYELYSINRWCHWKNLLTRCYLVINRKEWNYRKRKLRLRSGEF